MGFYELLDYLTWLSPVALFIGAMIGCLRFASLENPYRILVGYLLFELCIDIASRIISWNGSSNLIVIPFMNFAELLLFLGIYSMWLSKKIIPFMVLALVVFVVFFAREVQEIRMLPIGDMQTYTGILEAFFIVIFALLQFMYSLKYPEQMNWQRFSFNAVVLFYFSMKLLFSIPLNFLVNEDSGLSLLFWFAYLFITLFFYSYLILTLWKNGRTPA
nr:hypothetical protein [uncultured Fluviicola sp.]